MKHEFNWQDIWLNGPDAERTGMLTGHLDILRSRVIEMIPKMREANMDDDDIRSLQWILDKTSYIETDRRRAA